MALGDELLFCVNVDQHYDMEQKHRSKAMNLKHDRICDCGVLFLALAWMEPLRDGRWAIILVPMSEEYHTTHFIETFRLQKSV